MVPSNRCSCVDRQWAQLIRPIPIMSTETLASCADTRQAGAAKTSTAIKTRCIMRQIRAVATNQAAARRTVICAAIDSANGRTSAHTTAGRAAPTPPPKAPGPVATLSPGASDHLRRADANPRGSTEISRANAKFRGIQTTIIPCAMVFSQVWQTSIATACFSSFVHAPHYFHALIGTTLPVAAAGGLSQCVDQSAIRRRRACRPGVRADAPPSITPET